MTSATSRREFLTRAASLGACANLAGSIPLRAYSSEVYPAEPFPRLIDITSSKGIRFEHLSSPEQKYIVESMSGGVALIDYDRDGWLDIYFTNAPSVATALAGEKARSALYHNNRDGTFTDVTEKAGVGYPGWAMGAVVGDYNNDDWLNLFVANDGTPNYLYRNGGNGQFTDVAFEVGVAVSQDGNDQANMGVALGDYLHSGRLSIAITHFSAEYAVLFRNDGNLNFTDVSYPSGIARSTTRYVGWGDAVFDIDKDGWPDFVMVNGHVYPQVDSAHVGTKYREPKLLFLNQRDGTFRNVSKLAGAALQRPEVSRGFAVGDLSNDGGLDLVIENLQGQPMILRPEGGPRNHWVSLELQGTKSNRLALNARVRAVAGELVQTGEVFSGGSYLSQNDLRIQFGLGQHDRVDRLEIR